LQCTTKNKETIHTISKQQIYVGNPNFGENQLTRVLLLASTNLEINYSSVKLDNNFTEKILLGSEPMAL
jgi:hypothetical protein